jgi:hypothetical protein
MHRTATDERPKISLKRKVGYVEEQVSITRARMAEMQIDAQSNGPEKESEVARESGIAIDELD